MREIRDKLVELTAAYREQLHLYRQIKDVGSQEAVLIDRLQVDNLLEVLKEKESLLKKAGEHEILIKELQAYLVRHFRLDSFSLPQLKLVASVYYQKDLAALEGVIMELVPALEVLEEQERQNEANLAKYLEQSRGKAAGHGQAQRASRAYGRLKS